MMLLFRRFVAVCTLTFVLFIVLILVRHWAGYDYYDPYLIDYNAPGVDITSEGP